jgi:hypothetical protein
MKTKEDGPTTFMDDEPVDFLILSLDDETLAAVVADVEEIITPAGVTILRWSGTYYNVVGFMAECQYAGIPLFDADRKANPLLTSEADIERLARRIGLHERFASVAHEAPAPPPKLKDGTNDAA